MEGGETDLSGSETCSFGSGSLPISEYSVLRQFWTPKVTEGVFRPRPSFFRLLLGHVDSFDCDYHARNLVSHALKLLGKRYIYLKIVSNSRKGGRV